MQNLERRPSGIYVARLTIPIRLRAAVGARVFVASTGARDLAVAKLVASEQIARWRRHLFDLERLSLHASSMTQESILKIADGHPLLLAGGYIPLEQAAAVLGLSPRDLLRQAASGRLMLCCRLQGVPGYKAQPSSFEPEDPELGTVLIPSSDSRPAGSKIHRAFGIYCVPRDETVAMANLLLTEGAAAIVVLEEPGDRDDGSVFVPDETFELTEQLVELSAIEVDVLRRQMADAIAPAALESARQSLNTSGADVPALSRSSMLLSKGIDEYARSHLPQSISSPKETARIRNGLMLLAEFEGDLPLRQFTPDLLRNFRDVHLAKMPAQENQVRAQFKTTSMSESVLATAGGAWPRMSAGERDIRMKWIYRMFRWFHAQKWIVDDPCTGLRGESVLNKVERKQAASARAARQEFSKDEINKIFTAPVYQAMSWKATKAGTFRTFQPFHYWLPLLGHFTGARIGELCQLYLDDVRCEEGAWFIDINERTSDKSLKNAWSARRVPLHPTLVELGLIRWCEQLRHEGFQRLFPELSWNATNRYAKEPIRSMSQFFVKLGMPRDGTKVFHSFRHGVNNRLQKHSGMSDVMRKRMMGHEPGEGVNERHYLSDPKPSEMLAFMSDVHVVLPLVASFDTSAGTLAVKDALRRKSGGRGAEEAVGLTVFANKKMD